MDEHDNVEQLTELCHRAYAEHAAQGRRFFGSYQSVEDTRRRVLDGECWVAVVDGEFVGTVTVSGPGGFPTGTRRHRRPAVSRNWRWTPRGAAPGWATLCWSTPNGVWRNGAATRSSSTSSAADELLAWYGRRGYAVVGRWTWSVTNYDSTVLRKKLPAVDGRGD